MSEKHSAGPWAWEPGDPTIEGANGGAVCHMADHVSMHTVMATGEHFSSADARLIVEAPALLALARYAAERGEGDAEMAREILARIDRPKP